MIVNILATVSLLIMLLMLRPFVEILPSLLACLIRWKESVNLDNVVKYARYRNWIAIIMIIPFCITAYEFDLYDPDFLDGMPDGLRLFSIIAVFLAYILLRYLVYFISMSKNKRSKTSDSAITSSYNFFIIMTILSILEGGLLTFAEVDQELVRNIILWSCSGIYAISLVRKLQILTSYYNLYSAILYLCAFEILPTGAFITSAIIF